jgi:hypothetical protein
MRNKPAPLLEHSLSGFELVRPLFHQEHPDRLKIELYRAKAMEDLEQAVSCKDLFLRNGWTNIA